MKLCTITPTFNEISQSGVCTYHHREANGEFYFLTLLNPDKINSFTRRHLSFHDLLFNDKEDAEFISCGLKYGIQPGERPDLVSYPIHFDSDWRAYSLDGLDDIYVVSKYNGEIIIRRQNKFPGQDCDLSLLDIARCAPKYYKYLVSSELKTGKISCIFIKRGDKLLLLALMRHMDGQPQPQEMVDLWATDMGIERPIPIKNPSPSMLLQLCFNYNLKKILFHKETIIQISSPWFAKLEYNKHSLTNLETLTGLWISHKTRDFKDFSDKVNRVQRVDSSLSYVNSAYTRLSKLHGYLKIKLSTFNDKPDKYKFANTLPDYLQSLAFHIINEKDFKFDIDRLKSLYNNIIRINMGLKPTLTT